MQPRPIVGGSHRVVPSVLFCIGLVSSKDLLISGQVDGGGAHAVVRRHDLGIYAWGGKRWN